MKFFTIRNIVLILFILFALFLLANTNILEPLSEKRNPDKVLSKNLLLKQPLYDDNKVIKYKEENTYKYDIDYALDKPWTTGPDGKLSGYARVKNGVINKNYYCMDHRIKGNKGTCFNPPEYKKTCNEIAGAPEDERKISCPSGWKRKTIIGEILSSGAETQIQRCYCKYNVVTDDEKKTIDNLWNKCMSKWPKRLAYGVYKKDKNGRELRVNEVDLGNGLYGVKSSSPAEWPADGSNYYSGVYRQPYEQTNYGPWGWLNTYNKYLKTVITIPSGYATEWSCNGKVSSETTGVHGQIKY
jgi:hypothetical protein